MSRKSLSGKKKTQLWFYCEKCSSHITHKDWDFHTKNCPAFIENSGGDSMLLNIKKQSLIHNGILYTTNLDIKKITPDLADIPTKELNKLIFISESAMRLCNFVSGEEIVINCTRNNANTDTSLSSKEATEQTINNEMTLVRIIWPISETFLTSVFVSENGK